MKHQYTDGFLYFYFYEDLDSLTVYNLEQIYIGLIEEYQPKMVKLDLEEVTFVDSTGISFALARCKQLQKLHTRLILCNLPKVNQTLFKVSGIFQIVKHKRNEVKL